LGLTCLIYHGAEHSRFGHSLGVMDVADKIFDIIHQKDKSTGDNLLTPEYGWNEDSVEKYKIILRLWALLHDIGHCPFSHAAEGLFEKNVDHEKMGGKIINEDGSIRDIINSLYKEYEINSELISSLVGKSIIAEGSSEFKFPYPVIKQIIDGPLDSDKIDYLWRDSMLTGVYYGRFDLERLVNTMVIVFDKGAEHIALGIEEGGKYSAESLILSRYYMFLQVYFHNVRRAYDKHLSQFLKGYFKLYMDQNHYPSETNKFLEYDDNKVMGFMYESLEKKDDCSYYANSIINRQHYRTLIESSDFSTVKESKVFKRSFERIKKKFPKVDILLDSASDAPNKFSKDAFYVKLKKPKGNDLNSRYVEIDEVSDIITKLGEIEKYRVYVPKEHSDEIKKERDSLTWKP